MEGYNCNFLEGGKSYILVLFSCIIIYDPPNEISQGDRFPTPRYTAFTLVLALIIGNKACNSHTSNFIPGFNL